MLLAALLHIYRGFQTATVATATDKSIHDGGPHILQDKLMRPNTYRIQPWFARSFCSKPPFVLSNHCELTEHARDALEKRHIELARLERVFDAPEATEADPVDSIGWPGFPSGATVCCVL